MRWAAPNSPSSTWRPDCWRSLSSTSFQCCSATATAIKAPTDGARLFDNLHAEVQLEQVRAVEAPGGTHLRYRVMT